jgi:predicted dehydrogenase
MQDAKPSRSEPPLRAGMIGLDTSHVVAFTELLHDPAVGDRFGGLRVACGFPGGNPDFPLSRDRVGGFTDRLRALNVEIVGSIDALLSKVDVVFLESVDGTQHLEQLVPVFEAGKPVFVDKPLAASLEDCVAIFELGRRRRVPWFTSSSSRWTAGYRELRGSEAVGEVLGCDAYSQSRAAPGHPDLFWYGMHGVDLLYTLMGVGCRTVSAAQTPYTESVRGVWADGRVGAYRSIREHTGQTGLGVTVFGSRGIVYHDAYYDYAALLGAVARFFRNGESPVAPEEMLEVFAYLEAAEESKRRGGVPVELEEVLGRARGGKWVRTEG